MARALSKLRYMAAQVALESEWQFSLLVPNRSIHHLHVAQMRAILLKNLENLRISLESDDFRVWVSGLPPHDANTDVGTAIDDVRAIERALKVVKAALKENVIEMCKRASVEDVKRASKNARHGVLSWW